MPITNVADELEVMVIVAQVKVKSKKTLADFAGKMNSNIDWLAYQKEIRNEYTEFLIILKTLT